MKIDDSIKKTGGLPVSPAQTRGAGRAAGSEAAGSTGAASDNVHISAELKALSGQVASSSVFDAGKVEEIKAAIAGGQFQVDPEKVATGLLESVRDLIHSRKH